MKSLISKAISANELTEQLRQLGLFEGANVEVHSSLSSIGFVIGGAQSVVDALLQCVGKEGTIMVPTQDGDNSEPLFWANPPIALSQVNKVRDNMPGYNIHNNEIPYMGKIAENVHGREEAYHSYHPNCAFAAIGKNALYLMSDQTLNFPLSDSSPLGRLYQLDGLVLLIGTDYNRATALHLAEYRSKVRNIFLQGGAVLIQGKTQWKKYLDIDLNSDEFVEIGREMEGRGMVATGKLGEAVCRLFRMRDAVDFACEYLKRKHS